MNSFLPNNPNVVFGEEIAHISSPYLKEFVFACLLFAPAYFWQAPASSSGKNHPWWARTQGGLVRHTKAAVWVGLELLEAHPELQQDKDYIIVALLLHDTLKYGLEGQKTVREHPLLPQKYYAEHKKILGEERYKKVMDLIASHMGLWGPERIQVAPSLGRMSAAELVHLADYIASRPWNSMYTQDGRFLRMREKPITKANTGPEVLPKDWELDVGTGEIQLRLDGKLVWRVMGGNLGDKTVAWLEENRKEELCSAYCATLWFEMAQYSWFYQYFPEDGEWYMVAEGPGYA
ncbi:HD domain-containing protein [Moorellaceae bacterium AZ2]